MIEKDKKDTKSLRQRRKALINVGYLWAGFLFTWVLMFLVAKYVLSFTHTRSYAMVFLRTLLRPLLFSLLIFILVLLLTSSKEVYYLMLDYQKVRDIERTKKISFDDLRYVVRFDYRPDPSFKAKSFTVISSSLVSIALLIFAFFIAAFLINIYCTSEVLAYFLTLIIWTAIFVGYFYIFKNRFLTTDSREIYIFLLLLTLYVAALIISKGRLGNAFIFYTPYMSQQKNYDIQMYLNTQLIRYAEYVTDWSIIQGVLLSILMHYNFGKRRQDKFEEKMKARKSECAALLELIDIIEDIYANPELLVLCTDVENRIIYRQAKKQQCEKLLAYYNRITVLYPIISDSSFPKLLENFSLEAFTQEEFGNIIATEARRKRIKICQACKTLFYPVDDESICKECKKTTLLGFLSK